MGWFRAPLPAFHDPAPYSVSVGGPEGRWAGAGLVLAADTVLTCAHVVNDALGRHPFEVRTPGPGELHVAIRMPYGRYERCPARVAHWIPPRAKEGGPVHHSADEWLGDLAVLRVDAPPGSTPAPPHRSALRAGQEVRAWHASGHDATFADLKVKTDDGPIAYLDGEATGMAVGPGYSGGPLWCLHEKAVVGLVAAHFMPPRDATNGRPVPPDPQHLIRRSWGIPWQRIEAELRTAGVPDLTGPASAGPDEAAFGLLAEAIGDALPTGSELGDVARRLATECGVGHGGDVTPPAVEEFAAFLLQHPRALPVLTGLLRNNHPEAADRILAAGQLSRVPRLLSPREHHQLHARLRDLDPGVLARFAEAVRAALPLAAAFPGGETLDALIDHLETLPGDGRSEDGEPRVPALLRVLEYVGALCAQEHRARLRIWSDGVAKRLGIPRSALAERRSDGLEWARAVRGRSRVRVLVQVRAAEPGRHRLRIWCDEGTGPRQVSTDTSPSYTAREAARELIRVLETLTPATEDAERPLVEVLVDDKSLNLPVDEWEAQAPGQIVPGVLGVEYPLVVHCPDLLRRHERFQPDWRRRWRLLDTGATLVVSGASLDPKTLYAELMDRLDAVRVLVDVPAEHRDRIVQICLAMGIPVVVWDRARDQDSHAVERLAEAATRELPDKVRSYRANTVLHPREYPGRPVLAWADADRTVPRLHLTEPQESA
ncbi:trypsin-like peptidase domain-containing protein [Streptomyces sp. DG2A-72]|uniref:VMAP-C domain-containing protein n=1 Tax=Streptomyces sp. DG2A-72 TaxID=3051386 RepID=UPI00265BB899|nr:trypsin-like peptidase domain-containing protein [Streptomyces sp. DG2A-72]MDO0935763.1 trypsin-like peptidase domain-containing protein [Streptomyces sp. DG2A-72]